MECPANVWKVDRRHHGRTESWRMVRWLYGKLEDPATTQKVDGDDRWSSGHTELFVRSHGYMKSWQKLMEGPVDSWKVDGRSHGLSRVDGSWQNVLLQHRKLTEGHMDKRKVDKCWRKVLLLHNQWLEGRGNVQKLDKIYERSHWRTESW